MLILYHAQVHTSKPGGATALAIDGGRIVATGSDADILAEFGFRAQRQDMQGRTIWPGLIDAHLHLSFYSFGLQRVNAETASQTGCLAAVAEKARQLAPGSWLLGHGWNQNIWPEGFGTAAMLDQAAPENPVFLTSKSIHSAWANSRALALAGITASTPDPDGGAIQRDAQGNPTGILFESAMSLVERVIPAPTLAEMEQALLAAQPTLWQMGLTGVHDFDGPLCFAGLQNLDQRQELRLRVLKGIRHENLNQAVELGLRSGFGSEYLRIGSLKLFADGALGPRTAAMLQPYEGDEKERGFLMLDAETVFEIGQKAAQTGLSLAIHAIGDDANHQVINGFELLRKWEEAQRLPHLRHRIEHVQILQPADLPRLKALDIIASMQPIHATSDMIIADHHWGERARYAYAWQSLLQEHTRLAFGSDAPVESPNPFWGLHAAVTRRRMDGTPGEEGWRPMQRLNLNDALLGYTQGAAYTAGLENLQGQLAPGFWADLIVLDVNPFTVSPDTLHSIRPTATMVGGEWVWRG
ncbi:MAG TPA: amidohydrolase [Anaerolineaceae bacterium]|nr:amidohydrolase [Anaerolineaceae bacterium]HPN53931.1 amidohydrolase [Anaerolineaceae bacterium]